MICKIMSREGEPTQMRWFSDREHMISLCVSLDVNMSTYWTSLIKSINLESGGAQCATLTKYRYSSTFLTQFHNIGYANQDENQSIIPTSTSTSTSTVFLTKITVCHDFPWGRTGTGTGTQSRTDLRLWTCPTHTETPTIKNRCRR